jgi:hypothetical protein
MQIGHPIERDSTGVDRNGYDRVRGIESSDEEDAVERDEQYCFAAP